MPFEGASLVNCLSVLHRGRRSSLLSLVCHLCLCREELEENNSSARVGGSAPIKQPSSASPRE